MQVAGDLVGRRGIAERDREELERLVDIEDEISRAELGQAAGLPEPVDRERHRVPRRHDQT